MNAIKRCGIAGIVATLGVGCGDDPPNPIKEAFAQTSASVAQPSSLLRFGGNDQGGGGRGGVQLYRLPNLEPLPWRFETINEEPSRILGFDPGLTGVYFTDTAGVLTLLDLTTGGVRILDSMVARAALSQTNEAFLVHEDGALTHRTARRTEPWPDTLSRIPARLWPTTRRRVTALFDTDAGPAVALLSAEWDGTIRNIPDGPVTATPWGDLLIVAVDSGLVTVDPVDGTEQFLRLRRDVIRAVSPSPSAHRFYAATDAEEFLQIQRSSLSILTTQPLPGPVDAIRPDPRGRFLALRPTAGDEIWIAQVTDLGDSDDPLPVRRIRGAWTADLPVIAANGTLLVREGNDVVAYDPASGVETGRIRGAPRGRWIPIPWDPQPPPLQLAAETDEPRVARTDGLIYYAQVSSTSNQAWAEDLAQRLEAGGVDATVLPPTSLEDRYRVVLGPFPSREQADDMGRRLGRAYFVFSQEGQ